MPPLASDPIKILDTEEEEEKDNDIHVLELPAPITPPRTVEDAVCFQHAIHLGYWKPNCPRSYPAITFPCLAYTGLSLQAEIHSAHRKAHGIDKISSLDNQGESGYVGGDSGGDDGEDSNSKSVYHSFGPVAADFDWAWGSQSSLPRYQPEESPVGNRQVKCR